MPNSPNSEIFCHGLLVYRGRHQMVRRLKRLHTPSTHGYRVWTSSWLLMDYFHNCGLPNGLNVMDVGCGWGLAGMYFAKNHQALVTGVDCDADVFPFLRLHSEANGVSIATLQKTFDQITTADLNQVDVMIGADICFWDDLVDPLYRLFQRALEAGVSTIAVADPGRMTFDALEDRFVESKVGHGLDWHVRRPFPIQGRILRIGDGPIRARLSSRQDAA